MAILSGSPQGLENMAESPESETTTDLAEVCAITQSTPAGSPSHYATLGVLAGLVSSV